MDRVEFKSSARINMHTGDKDARMEHVIVKTVSGFLNGGAAPCWSASMTTATHWAATTSP
ncbi:hypothetical protein V1Y59_13715 [Gordonia sp. PKS22-38]|uniref:Uncharacterized protein n=1 Tax=Gordonia prachuapensis TaxID=3115651 RepID=A0ABU7MUX2_9ACTN|nr:hypothetical protein [Gordonia sp. PKS22-38]